jgi:hypothetical protein
MPKPREYSETGRKKLAHGKGTRWYKRSFNNGRYRTSPAHLSLCITDGMVNAFLRTH